MRACGAPWQVAPRPVPRPARRAVAAKAKGGAGGPAKPERVDRLLSRLGYCSRADAKRWVKDARVTVDGVPVARHDVKVLATAEGGVRIDDQPPDHPDGLIAVLHKPKGVVCSHDEREGPNVYGLLPPRWRNRNPSVEAVGRLDKDTTGLLLFTDDGAKKVIKEHPFLERTLDVPKIGQFKMKGHSTSRFEAGHTCEMCNWVLDESGEPETSPERVRKQTMD